MDPAENIGFAFISLVEILRVNDYGKQAIDYLDFARALCDTLCEQQACKISETFFLEQRFMFVVMEHSMEVKSHRYLTVKFT